MIAIPAIDIKGGRCVRLRQGRMSEETVYSDAPDEMAVIWFEKGAERLHVVDLDGAIGRKPVNLEAVKKIVNSVPKSDDPTPTSVRTPPAASNRPKLELALIGWLE